MTNDPWDGLAAPTKPGVVNARRVDERGKWHFYWGRDSERRCVLVLRHGAESTSQQPLPHFRGVDVISRPAAPHESPSIVIQLLDASLHDVFLELCRDIMASSAEGTTESQAVAITVARAWRWHHLVRGGGSGLLTREEQKGLIAELLVLERYLLPVLPTTEAIAAWRGPLGSAKDFIIGTTAIECKAHATGAPPVVVVSSEYQLDDVETPWLFLHVSTFETAEGLEEDGFTVTEIANRVRERLAGHDGPAEGQYAALLEAAGFRSGDDYTQARWRGGERGIYRVSDAFPRIIAKGLPSGVSHVKYALSLAQCAGYLVPSEQLGSAIRGPSHGE